MLGKLFEQLPINEVYKDLFKPSMKKAGEALAVVMDSATLILLPLRLLNERSKVYFQKNIEKYSEKINAVEGLTLTEVPQHIGLPIIEKLTYLNQEDLSNAFINLLAKASFEETLIFIHPAYLDILNRISTDEAIILSEIKDCIPYINIAVRKNPKEGNGSDALINSLLEKAKFIENGHAKDSILVKQLTGIEVDFNLNYPNNINIYLENLKLNGLLDSKDSYDKNRILTYQNLEEKYKNVIDEAHSVINEVFTEDLEYKTEIIIQYGYLQLTELGKGFLNMCIKDINEK
ncbi:uncharacterized protein DUF4393 [Dysgonomonas alginatilytica]|uniref:Uncharacterized protein DUF4393 n=1 Tax=Dysgonomonas alginatilytica TaxID=1605892 RepID=A0A2V3PT14_9BACT|nr:Abi-alpha family protein [Dysgonomonas alginatilytica]PXV67338.1 uncharacterized protein DUF4393 [Dysgonomonas alginatilytica]